MVENVDMLEVKRRDLNTTCRKIQFLLVLLLLCATLMFLGVITVNIIVFSSSFILFFISSKLGVTYYKKMNCLTHEVGKLTYDKNSKVR